MNVNDCPMCGEAPAKNDSICEDCTQHVNDGADRFEEAYEAYLDSMEPGNLYADQLRDEPPPIEIGPGDHAPGETPSDYFVNDKGQLWFPSLDDAIAHCANQNLPWKYVA